MVVKKILKAEKKAEKTAEQEELGRALSTAASSGRRGRFPVSRNNNNLRQAQAHQHVSTANFLSGLFNPYDSPSRFPDKMNLLKTVVFPFRETGVCYVGVGGFLHLYMNPTMQNVLQASTGTGLFAWGTTSISNPAGKMFTASAPLNNFVIAARCTGMKLKIEYGSTLLNAQGLIVAAVIPPGFGGGTIPPTTLSILPHSAQSSIATMAANGAFEICWLPQRGAGNYEATVPVGQGNAPYDPLEFIPFNAATDAVSDGMPTIQLDVSGSIAGQIFLVTAEGTFECDCMCGSLMGSDERPSEDAWEVMDDLADPLFEKFSGVQPSVNQSVMTAPGQASAGQIEAPQTRVIQAAIEGAPDRMSEKTASFLDMAGPVLGQAGSEAWKLVKEYGPDALSSVVGLLPGGSLATTAAKIGTTLGKWLL